VAELCRLYDPLLSSGAVSPGAVEELSALARIFDLDCDRPPAEVWKDVRKVVTRQAGPGGDDVDEVEPLTLLIVEDDAEMAADLVATVSEAGHRAVGPFRTAAAAEVAAALHPVDLALLDINLADEGSGVELARTLKGRWGVRSIFLSGDVTAAARHADLAEALVTKPYSGREVLAAVARAAA
jgi:CheY-like chemotaxis protein